jgi:HTH-type transcriptional regulator / antitoxin HipB
MSSQNKLCGSRLDAAAITGDTKTSSNSARRSSFEDSAPVQKLRRAAEFPVAAYAEFAHRLRHVRGAFHILLSFRSGILAQMTHHCSPGELLPVSHGLIYRNPVTGKSTVDDILYCRRSLSLIQCRRTMTLAGGAMRIRTAVDIGALIRDRRTRLGLKQQDLADKAGVSRQWLIEVEKGKPRAELGLVLRTIEELGISLATGDIPRPEDRKRAQAIDIDRIVDAAREKRK